MQTALNTERKIIECSINLLHTNVTKNWHFNGVYCLLPDLGAYCQQTCCVNKEQKVTAITYEDIHSYAQLCTVFRLFFLPDLAWELVVTCTKAQITVNRRLRKKILAQSQNVARCPLARVLFSVCPTNATHCLNTRAHTISIVPTEIQ